MRRQFYSRKKLQSKDLTEKILDFQLAEYESLNNAVHNQMDGIRQIVINSMLIAGVAIPVLIALVQQQIYVALLLLPIIFSSAAWMFQFHTLSIFITGFYITNRLAKEVKKNIIGSRTINHISIWEFDSVYSGKETKGWKNLVIRFLGSLNIFFALILLLLPGIVSLTTWYIVRGISLWMWWEFLLFFFNLGLIVVVFIFAGLSPYLAGIYLRKRS